jgi:hypothetical protein
VFHQPSRRLRALRLGRPCAKAAAPTRAKRREGGRPGCQVSNVSFPSGEQGARGCLLSRVQAGSIPARGATLLRMSLSGEPGLPPIKSGTGFRPDVRRAAVV